MALDEALITANSSGVRTGGGFIANEASYEAFPKYLRTVVGEGLMSIEEAVRKVTSVPAEYFDIKDRGKIEEGRAADLVLLSKDN